MKRHIRLLLASYLIAGCAGYLLMICVTADHRSFVEDPLGFLDEWIRTTFFWPIGVVAIILQPQVQGGPRALAFCFLGPGAILYLLLARFADKPAKPGLCPTCGYDLRATPERCPECGTVISPNPAEQTKS